MKALDATNILLDWDQRGRYVYRRSDLSVLLGESGSKLDNTLSRLVESSVLTRAADGVYVLTKSRNLSAYTLEHVAQNLRRGHITFESLESALAQWGVISEIPIDRITLMTTGRSGTYTTPYGTIEFTHTKEKTRTILEQVIKRPGRLPIASQPFALKNLRSVGRNLHLINREGNYEQD